MSAFIALLSGVVLAVGLAVSGMTRPDKILAFLDVTGRWDPSVSLVMVGAIAVYAIGHRWTVRRGAPLLAPKLLIPTRRDLDWRLVVGASVFGMGWGLGGYCPGPALASLGNPTTSTLAFAASMLVGMGLFAVADPWLNRAAVRTSPTPPATVELPRAAPAAPGAEQPFVP